MEYAKRREKRKYGIMVEGMNKKIMLQVRGGNDCENQNYSSTDGGGIPIGNTDRLWSGRFGAG